MQPMVQLAAASLSLAMHQTWSGLSLYWSVFLGWTSLIFFLATDDVALCRSILKLMPIYIMLFPKEHWLFISVTVSVVFLSELAILGRGWCWLMESSSSLEVGSALICWIWTSLVSLIITVMLEKPVISALAHLINRHVHAYFCFNENHICKLAGSGRYSLTLDTGQPWCPSCALSSPPNFNSLRPSILTPLTLSGQLGCSQPVNKMSALYVALLEIR